MDQVTEQIAAYAHNLSYDDLPAEIVVAAKQRLLDTIGCALGGRGCDAAVVARHLATASAPDHYPGRILGQSQRSAADSAAFANTVMIRYLDFNDSHQASHPSDMLGAILALAETAGADGRRLISSMVVGYEVMLRIVHVTRLRERGWDQGYPLAIGAAAALGHLLALPLDRIAHAISITAVSSMQLRATRAGALSAWKGAATADSVRNAVFATLLAAEGMTGPDKPFEGRHGLCDLITGPVALPPFADAGGDYLLLHSFLKFWPVVLHAQAAIWAAIDLRAKMTADDISSIDIATYQTAWHSTASEAEKWNPTTRETADHSMPYIFARAFLDGGITVESFAEAAIRDPAAKALMDKIAAHADDEIEAVYRSAQPTPYLMRVRVGMHDGSEQFCEILHPRGMCQNPMSDAEIGEKFSNLATPILGAKKATMAANAWLNIDSAPDVAGALSLLQVE